MISQTSFNINDSILQSTEKCETHARYALLYENSISMVIRLGW